MPANSAVYHAFAPVSTEQPDSDRACRALSHAALAEAQRWALAGLLS